MIWEQNQLEMQVRRLCEEVAQLRKELDSIKTVVRLHNLQQRNERIFNTRGCIVEYIGLSCFWRQYIFNFPIVDSANFTIKIHRSFNKEEPNIVIGVLDYNQRKNEQQSKNCSSSVSFGGDGQKYPMGGKQQKGGFKEGDIVKVFINRNKNTIRYWVNGNVKADDKNQMLADSSRLFMPFVQMWNQYDAVQWLYE